MALRGIFARRRLFEYPTLAAMIGIAWVIPQGIELELNVGNPYASEAFWLYVAGCFLFILLGFEVGKKAQRKRIARDPERNLPTYKMKRLLISAAALTALGQFAAFQVRSIDTSGMGGQWTGIVTMWYLLAAANGFGLCLGMLIFSRNRSPAALAIALIAVVPIFQAAIGGVRREQLFDLVILTAGVWFFVRRRYPPRLIVIVGLILGTVIINTAGDLRSEVRSGQQNFLSVLLSEGTYRNFDYFALGQGEASEVGLAQYDFWYSNQTWRWELGANHWNILVHQYVPAFLVGRGFKDSLKISTLSERLRGGEVEGAFSLGSTRTGFSDSYRAIGVFGVLIFAAIGYGFGFLYANAAMGGIAWQYFYFVLMAEGLKTITHSTGELLSALPFTIILSLIVLNWSKMKLHKIDRKSLLVVAD